ncbi:MAG: hypothetical protein WCJ80_11895 [Bacteroidota bacterium]
MKKTLFVIAIAAIVAAGSFSERNTVVNTSKIAVDLPVPNPPLKGPGKKKPNPIPTKPFNILNKLIGLV